MNTFALLSRSFLRNRTVSPVALVIAAAVAGACSDSTAPGSIATLRVASGDSQTVSVTTPFALPLIVAAFDQNSKPVPGVLVTFLTSDAGTFNNATATTDAAGRAQVSFTPGKVAGPIIVSATVPSLPSAAFDLTATPAPPSATSKSGGDQQTGSAGAALSTPFVAKVLDQFGNPVPGTAVTWTATSGTLVKTDQVTDANGEAKATFKLGNTPGTETVTAHVAGASDVVFTAIAQ